MRVYRSDVVSLRSAEAKPPRSVHRLDEPAGLSLSMVTSPQCRFRFARQNHCSAAATSAVNFRMARHSPVILNTADQMRPSLRTPPCRTGNRIRNCLGAKSCTPPVRDHHEDSMRGCTRTGLHCADCVAGFCV